jgi:hypothetical protein
MIHFKLDNPVMTHILDVLSFKLIENDQLVETNHVPSAILVDSKTFRHQQDVDKMYRPAWVTKIAEQVKTNPPQFELQQPPKDKCSLNVPDKKSMVIYINLQKITYNNVNGGIDTTPKIRTELQSQLKFDIKSRIIPQYNEISIKFVNTTDEYADAQYAQIKNWDRVLQGTQHYDSQHALSSITSYDPSKNLVGRLKYLKSIEDTYLKRLIMDYEILRKTASTNHKYNYMYHNEESAVWESPPCRPYWQKFFFIIHIKIPDPIKGVTFSE